MKHVTDTRAYGPRLVRRLKSLIGDVRGVAAVEFAMLLPLMMTLYLGVVEVSQGIAIARKVTLTTRTLADLSSRVTTINNADMTNILNASSTVLAPYPVSNLKVVLTAVEIKADGTNKVLWSDTLNGTKRAVGSSVTLDAALAVANTTLILSEVEYAYKPTIGYVVTGTLTLKDKMYMRPRMSTSISRPNS
jgi:Flp pilus assembly protein TadG